MEDIKKFNKGMSQDINPLDQPDGTYISADNLRIISDVSGSSLSITNILGNTLNVSIPSTPTIQKVVIIAVGTANAFATININNQVGAQFNCAGKTYQDLYNFIISDPAYTQCNQNINASSPLYNIYYGTSSLLIVPFIGNTIINTVVTNITVPALDVINDFVPAQSNLEPIGFTTIRNDIYIYTTNNTSKDPEVLGSFGQIWKYTYDKVNFIGSLELKYNNKVNFSTYWNISPSATLGRYENNSIQRIYWTDFYNKLRSLNVSDEQSMALDLSEIDVVPSVDFDMPILQGIKRSTQTTGTKAGVYQIAYRLKKTTGAITNYSELSNSVTSVYGDENPSSFAPLDNGWSNYVGSAKGSYTNKVITWKIDNIDKDFDFLEAVILFRDIKDGVPNIGMLDDIQINNRDSISISFDGSELMLPVTLTEFISTVNAFTHCKTIGTKDNRLFAGNIKNKKGQIEWDARAFRSADPGNVTGSILLTNNGVQESFAGVIAAAATPETDDSINDYSDPTRSCIYKPGSTSFTLGGAGKNISYEFYTVAIPADISLGGTTGFTVDLPSPYGGPSIRTVANTVPGYWHLGVNGVSNQNTLAGQYYPSYSDSSNFIITDGLKFPQLNGLYTGYNRGEIYRFGIQFFDKSKNPMFVKWIGDIKMPEFADLNTNSFFEDGTTPTGLSDFRLSFKATVNSVLCCFTQLLGIRFTVENLDSIKDQIGGYSIVRVKRKQSDKLVVCQGYITKIDEHSPCPSCPNVYYSTGPDVLPFPDGQLNVANYSGTNSRGFFTTPNINDSSLLTPNSSMKLVPKYVVNLTDGPNTYSGSAENNGYAFYKYYEGSPFTNLPPGSHSSYDLAQFDLIGYYSNGTDSASGDVVANYTRDGYEYSKGNPAYYYRSKDYAVPDDVIGTKTIYNIEKELNSSFLESLYGGNTYNARSNSEYISCNHYRPIRNSITLTQDNFEVFGGDTFVNIYDSMRLVKNWNTVSDKYAYTFYIPFESPINTGLRSGIYCVKNLRSDDGANIEETYVYNNVYSSENSIRTYFPKPNPFILSDEFDNRIYASEVKINGELSDSWGEFKVNNYWDVEGSYGPINAMTNLNDKMFFWQNRAFGIMSINPRALVKDVTNGTDLQLGTGLVLQRHDYVTTEVGLQHQYGMTKSNSKLFWADVNLKKMFTFGGDGGLTQESDVKGLFSFFSSNLVNNILKIDKPVYEDPTLGLNGVRAVFDFKYNQAIFTFSDGKQTKGLYPLNKKFTLILDENINAFTSFTDYTPKMYMSDGYRIMSPSPYSRSDIYMHDLGEYVKYYGTVYQSSLKLVSNKGSEFDKVFDNIVYDSQSITNDVSKINQRDDTWNTIRVYNDYQNTDYQDLIVNTNIKRRERYWKLDIPRNRVLYTTSSPDIFTDLSATNIPFAPRMRDKYIVIDLIYNNANNLLLAFNNLRTIFRISDR